MRIKFIALALATVLPIAGAQAADRPDMRAQWHKTHQETLIQELKLDPAQQQKFLKKSEDFHSKQIKQRQEFHEKQQLQHEKHRNELRKLLTPEQRVVFDRHHEKMKNIRDNRRQKHGRMHPKHHRHGKGMHKPMHQHQGGQPMHNER